MSNKTALIIAGTAVGLGVLYILAHSWNVTGVIELGQPTISYTVGTGGNDTPTGSVRPIP